MKLNELNDIQVYNFINPYKNVPALLPCDTPTKCKNRYNQEPKIDKVRKKKRAKRHIAKQSKKRR